MKGVSDNTRSSVSLLKCYSLAFDTSSGHFALLDNFQLVIGTRRHDSHRRYKFSRVWSSQSTSQTCASKDRAVSHPRWSLRNSLLGNKALARWGMTESNLVPSTIVIVTLPIVHNFILSRLFMDPQREGVPCFSYFAGFGHVHIPDTI